MRQVGARAAISFSLANLLCLRAWRELNWYTKEPYYSAGPPGVLLQALTLVTLILLAAAIYGLARAAESKHRAARIGGTAGLAALTGAAFLRWGLVLSGNESGFEHITSVLQHFFEQSSPNGLAAAVAAVVVAASLGYGVAKWPDRARSALSALLVVLLPILFVNLGSLAIGMVHSPAPEAFRPRPSAPYPAQLAERRLVWIVFDEMDQEFATTARPSGVRMPAFDRMQAESFAATQAVPAGPWTREAIPALLSGRSVVRAEPDGVSDLELVFAGGATGKWSRQASVFARAAALGLSSALVGWYHPYCRVLGDELASCYTTPTVSPHLPWRSYAELVPFSAAVQYHAARELIGGRSRELLQHEFLRREAVSMVKDLWARAMTAASDGRLGLVFLHLPMPHPPGIWDPRARQLSASSEGTDYLWNYELADLFLQELGNSLDRSPLGQRTAILVTSDHSLRMFWKTTLTWSEEMTKAVTRSRLRHVPFVVRLPGDSQPARYTAEFNTALSSDLALEILKGKIRTSREIAGWFEQRKAKPRPERLRAAR